MSCGIWIDCSSMLVIYFSHGGFINVVGIIGTSFIIMSMRLQGGLLFLWSFFLLVIIFVFPVILFLFFLSSWFFLSFFFFFSFFLWFFYCFFILLFSISWHRESFLCNRGVQAKQMLQLCRREMRPGLQRWRSCRRRSLCWRLPLLLPRYLHVPIFDILLFYLFVLP